MDKHISAILLLFTCFLNAQEVTVLDFDTKFPIENCTIYGENNPKVIYTDKNGKGDVSIFAENDIIYFSYMSYIEVEVLKRRLPETNNIIYLHKKAESLDEVVLSATRQKESRSRVAEHIEVDQLRDIQKVAPQTSADLLASIPGIKVQKSQSGGGSPVLRGMEANRVLLVVDGVRMNNAIYRSGHLQNSITVAPSILERTEVIFGPSSVIYGSDALGGVIHYYTRTPNISEEKETKIHFMSRLSSINEEFTNQGGVEFSFKNWASLTNFSHSKFGDLKMGKTRNHGFENWGKVFEYSNNTDTFYNPNPVQNSNPNLQKNTGYEQSDFLQKFYFKLSESTNLIVNFQNSWSTEIPRFDKLTEYSNGELKFAEWHYGPQRRLFFSNQLSINPKKKWLDNGTITAAYQKIKESRIQRKFNSLDRIYRKENVDVYSLNGDFHIPLSIKSNRNLSYGFEVTYNEVNSSAIGKTLAVNGNEIIGFSDEFAVQSRYPDGGSSYTSSAVYSNYKQDINKKSTLNTGIRFTNTFLKAKWVDETFIQLPENDISLMNSALTATAGYTYRPTIDWQINTVLSSGFRSPNIDDIGKIREKNSKVSVPNIALKPEYAYNAEVGILKYFKDKKFNIGFNAYYTLLHNYIGRESFLINGSSTILYDDEMVGIYTNVNHDNAYVVGGTLSYEGRFSNYWNTKGSITYTKGKAYDTDLPLSSIPPIFGSIEIGYSKKRFETSLNFRFNGAKKVKNYNLNDGIDNIEETPIDPSTGEYYGTPSWSSLNFYSKYTISKSIDCQLFVDNLFDTHYKEFASSISSPGRNFAISILIH